MAWNRKAKRALRRLDRIFKANSPAYYKKLCKELDVGAYNCRAIAGTSTPSNHSFATAIDLDWQENARDGDYQSAMRERGMASVKKVEAEGFMRWGGRYSSPDDMHLEVIVTPEQLKRMYTWRGTKKRRYWRKRRA